MSYWEEVQTFGNGTGEFDILVATNVAFGALEPVCPAETIENGKMEV